MVLKTIHTRITDPTTAKEGWLATPGVPTCPNSFKSKHQKIQKNDTTKKSEQNDGSNFDVSYGSKYIFISFKIIVHTYKHDWYMIL